MINNYFPVIADYVGVSLYDFLIMVIGLLIFLIFIKVGK